MKQILKLSILLLFFVPLQKVAGQDIIMGEQSFVPNIGETIRFFYDPGGVDTFATGLRDTITFQTETSTKQLYFLFERFSMGDRDTLWIFDGPEADANSLIGEYSLVASPVEVFSTANTMTLVFHSDTEWIAGLNEGWKAQVYQFDTTHEGKWYYIDDPYVTTCYETFYDAGGPNGNIGNTESGSFQQFTSPVGSHIKCEFESFNVGGLMKIYDGQLNDPNRRLIGQFGPSTGSPPPVLISTKKTMTFEYIGVSGDANKSGWKANISCVAELAAAESPCPEVTNNFISGDYDLNSQELTMMLSSEEAAGLGIFGEERGIHTTTDINAIFGNSVDYSFSDPVVILRADAVATGTDTYDYRVVQIPYDESNMLFAYNEGNSINASQDDQWLSGVQLPFEFKFFGDVYTTVYPGTNGLISMSPQSGYCTYSYSAPSTTPPYSAIPYVYKNCVYGVYEDIDCRYYTDKNDGLGYGAVRVGVLGEFPCRAFVFNYLNVGLFGLQHGSTPNLYDNYNTYQMVLYEGTNIIDVYVKHRKCCASTNSRGEGIIGLQNSNSSQIVLAPGRGMTSWNANNEAWRFVPITAKPDYGKLFWFRDTVDWKETAKALVPDEHGPHCIAYSPTAKDSVIGLRPQDTALYISVYQYVDAGGQTITLYGFTKVNVDIPKIRVVSDKKTYCPLDTMILEVDTVFSDVMDTSNIIKCKWWSKKHPRPLGTSTTRKNKVAASYIPPDTYDTIYVTVTFENKAQRTDSVIVYVSNPILPTITSRNFVTKEDFICKGDTLTLLATHPKTKDFKWSTGAISRSIKVSPEHDSLFIVTTKSGCEVSDTFKVVVLPLPEPTFDADPIDIIMDDGIGTVTCTTPMSENSYQLFWNFGDPYSADSVAYGLNEVSHDYTRPGDYIISLKAIDANNCVNDTTERISVQVPDLFYVPSAFSPNSDNINDYFMPKGQIVDIDRPYSMEIFNRYGMLIYSTNSPYDYWDGRNKKGEMCPDGVYVYKITFFHLNDSGNNDALPRVYSGTVTLLK